MTHARVLFIALLATSFLITGCDEKPDPAGPITEPAPSTPAATEPEATKPSTQKPVEEVKKPAADTTAAAKKDDDKTDPAHMEIDPTATKIIKNLTTKALDDEAKALDDLMPKHKVVERISWTDSSGTNLLLIGTQELKNKGTKMTAALAFREGDGTWTPARVIKESVENCEFDIIMKPYVDTSWSVTDVDGDGKTEVTFAYTADCVSDVSPMTHKVLSFGGEYEEYKGEFVPMKYALRGVTKVKPGGGEVLGGEYKVDPKFDKAPKGLLEHAKKVWGKTFEMR